MPAPEAPAPADFAPELLSALLDLSLTGVVLYSPVHDAAGAVVDLSFDYLNPAAQRMLGLPARPAATFLQQFTDGRTNGAFAFHRDTLRADAPGAFEVNYQADGIDNYFRVAARRVGGQLLVSFTDTADQPRTAVEEALRASQARERAMLSEAEARRGDLVRLLEQAPVAFSLFRGPEHVIALANPEMSTIWGRPLGQTQGRPVLEALPEIADQGFQAVFDDIFQNGTPYDFLEAPVTLDRAHANRPALGYFNITYRPQYDTQGRIVGIVTLATEVTEQVQAREQVQALNEELAAINEELRASNEEFLLSNTALAEAQQALQALNEALEGRVARRTRQARAARAEAEQQRGALQHVFEQAPVAICVLQGPAYALDLLNPPMARMLGRPRAQLLGRPFFEALPELLTQGVREVLDEVRRTGTPFAAQERAVQLAHHRPDEPGYYNIVYEPLRDEHGRVAAVTCVAVDVTAQVRARAQVQALNEELAAINEEMQATNEELGDANDRLTRVNADLDTFVYTASHDLKAPIANIEGLLIALREQLPPAVLQAEPVPQLLGLMQGAVDRFQQTIAHLTDVSKLQLAHQSPAETVDLAALAEAVRLDLAPALAAAAGQLAVDVAACPTVRFSPKNLRSILYNLLSNAIKYHAPARPPAVALRAHRAGGRVVLQVQDNGLGLDEAQQASLYGLFQRLHTHVEGSGVGLYIVRKIVENGGGTIHVQSQPGAGTTFTVSLPG